MIESPKSRNELFVMSVIQICRGDNGPAILRHALKYCYFITKCRFSRILPIIFEIAILVF